MRDHVGRFAEYVFFWAVVAAVGLTVSTAGSQDKTCLWKVSSPKNSVYLLGSIHLLTKKDYPLAEGMEKAFDEADVVVFEVDPDSLQSPALQMYILTNAMYKDGKTLKSELGDSVYTGARSKAESLGVDLDLVSTFKPWFASLTVAIAEMQRLGFDPELGVEMHFAQKAKTDGKTVLGLETATEQMDLFITLSDEQQRDLFIHTLDQLSDIEKELGTILEAWRGGDVGTLEHTLNKSFKDYPDIHERLLIQRNMNWVEQIVEFLDDDKDYVVIVGVGHMPGDKGLIRLLEKRGYDIRQL